MIASGQDLVGTRLDAILPPRGVKWQHQARSQVGPGLMLSSYIRWRRSDKSTRPGVRCDLAWCCHKNPPPCALTHRCTTVQCSYTNFQRKCQTHQHLPWTRIQFLAKKKACSGAKTHFAEGRKHFSKSFLNVLFEFQQTLLFHHMYPILTEHYL